MNNVKSREHAHTCRKARAIFKLRYKNKNNALSGTLNLDDLPVSMQEVDLSCNNFTADPMDGHLSVVGRTTTPSWGKPGATRFYGDPPWRHRVTTRASSILHCHGILASVANTKRSGNKKLKKQETKYHSTLFLRPSFFYPYLSAILSHHIYLTRRTYHHGARACVPQEILIYLFSFFGLGTCTRIRGRPYA